MIDKKYFLTEKAFNGFDKMHPLLQIIAKEMISWVQGKGIEPKITSTISCSRDDSRLGRVSSSHSECRAFDLRSWDWPESLKGEFIVHFNEIYGNLGAISLKTNTPNLIVLHDSGHGEHFHIQLNRLYAIIENDSQ